jgi:hypothetical protein
MLHPWVFPFFPQCLHQSYPTSTQASAKNGRMKDDSAGVLASVLTGPGQYAGSFNVLAFRPLMGDRKPAVDLKERVPISVFLTRDRSTLTLILCSASSNAAVCVSPRTAHLLTV